MLIVLVARAFCALAGVVVDGVAVEFVVVVVGCCLFVALVARARFARGTPGSAGAFGSTWRVLASLQSASISNVAML